MGVLNVTPDSFSDGGQWLDPTAAVARGLELAAQGAALVDVGGESTRPGAEPVDEALERERTVPVVAALARQGTRVSIDTTKLGVAEAALRAGAEYVNDVTAFRADPELAGLVADRRAACCLMHMRGEPRTMQDAPRYDDVVDDVKAFLLERWSSRSARASGRSASSSTRASASARPRSTTWRSCTACQSSSRSASRWSSACRGRASSAASPRARSPATGSPGPWPRTCSRWPRAPVSSASTTSPSTSRRSRWRVLRCAAMPDPDAPLDPEEDDDLDGWEEDEEGARHTEVTIEVSGLSLYTHHGVSAAEREIGQRLVLDIRLEVGESDATVTDMVEDTVDYGEVVSTVALVAQQRSYKTLERLCSAIADRLLNDYEAEEVWVKAAKPEPPIALPVQEVSVEVWRQAAADE
jgi:dihydroneopterin aldolase